MNRSIQELLGIAGDEKRIYRFAEGEVLREEYEYCQLIDQLVFGDKGYVETLGQTWEMIHDPRFVKIESAFIVNRKAVFGGDARTGKQYMSSDGMFISTIADLEEYSEVLGEGRYFWLVLAHPDENCPMRLWYERIYPGILASKQIEAPPASPDLKCICALSNNLDVVKLSDPHDLKDAPDAVLWALLKQECPNYFSHTGNPNGMAKRMFALFRADLIGLIDDYCPTPLVDAYIELESGDVIEENDYISGPLTQPPQVFLEVDILEKALTYRATMRATAAKILRQMGIEAYLKDAAAGDMRLTDEERDSLLRMVYQSDWPNDKTDLMMRLVTFISGVTRRPFEEREKDQLDSAKGWSLENCKMLRKGEIQPINSYTEPAIDTQLDPHAAVMEAILRNPLKQELYIIWAEAERRSTESQDDTDRLNMAKLFSILTPIFTDPDFEVGDTEYWNYMEEARKLSFYGQKALAATHKGMFGDEDQFIANRILREARGEVRTPLPPDEPENPAAGAIEAPDLGNNDLPEGG